MLRLNASTCINPEQVEMIWKEKDNFYIRFTSGQELEVSVLVYSTLLNWKNNNQEVRV